MGGAEKSPGGCEKNAGGTKKNVGGVGYRASGIIKKISGTKKKIGGTKKNVGGTEKNAGGTEKNAGGIKKIVGGTVKNGGGCKKLGGGMGGFVEDFGLGIDATAPVAPCGLPFGSRVALRRCGLGAALRMVDGKQTGTHFPPSGPAWSLLCASTVVSIGANVGIRGR